MHRTFESTHTTDSIKKMALKLYSTSNTPLPLKPLNIKSIKKNNFFFEKRYSRENWSPDLRSGTGPNTSSQEQADVSSDNQIIETVSMDKDKVSRIQRLVQKIPGPQVEMGFDQNVQRLIDYTNPKMLKPMKKRYHSVGKTQRSRNGNERPITRSPLL